jgi:TonB-linked SusC/RagA family outer membrane protein
MQKNRTRRLVTSRVLLKFWKIMRLSVFFLFFFAAQTYATVTYSQQTRLTLKMQGAKVIDVLNKIEDESEFFFLFNQKLLDVERPVNVDVKNESIEKILFEIFEKTNVSFFVKDRQIILTTAISSSGSEQQQKSVTGKVTDSSGALLPGVSVVVKGTTTGIITDNNGNYSITGIPANAILQFSFVGMKMQEVVVGNKTTINITLAEEVIGLDEVVAVGYGTQSRTKITSSVSTLKTEELKNVPITNMASALAGRIAGVIVQSSGGEPGSVPSISIRGNGDPLYVIDGMVRDKDVFVTLSKEDISSVTILKDASATAVYGARAANGIINVVTKQGKKEEGFRINYNSNFAWNTPTKSIDLISSYSKAQVANAMGQGQGLGPFSRYSEQVLDTIKRGLAPTRYPNTNWWNETMRNYSPQNEHSLSVSGGTKATKYYFGLGYLDQGSIYKNNATDYNRYNYRSNVTTSFDKIGLDVSLNLYGFVTKSNSPPFSAAAIFGHMVASSPLEKPYNPDGTFTSMVDHPVAEMNSPGYDKKSNYYNNGNLAFKWSVPWVKGLEVKAIGDYVVNYKLDRNFTAYPSQYDDLGIPKTNPAPSMELLTSLDESYSAEMHINYSRLFGNHNLSATLVSIMNAGKYSWFSANRNDFMSTAVDQIFAGSSKSMTNDGNSSEWGRMGYVSRLKYDYKSKYLVEFTGRYDGSDNFPNVDNKRWGFFPAVSLGWTVSEEKFFSVLNDLNVLNKFKLRMSAGKIGDDNIYDTDGNLVRFAYVPSYNLNSQTYVAGGNLVNGFSEGDLVSNDLSWYTTKSYNVGFDFASLKNHLTGSFDYFYNRTTGYLTSPKSKYVDPLGKSLPKIISDAAYRKAGVDGSISYSSKIGDFSYQVGANMTYYNSLWEVANEDSVTKTNPDIRSQGVLENYYGRIYTSTGFYQSFDEVLSNPKRLGSGSLAPGDLMYQDLNGDGKIDGQDFTRTGKSSSPRFVFGFDLTAQYKGFTLNALIQGTGKRNLDIGGLLQAKAENRVNFEYQSEFWTPENTNARYPRAGIEAMNSSNNYASSTVWLVDASYIRLKSMSLAYDLKKNVFKNETWLNSFSVFISGTNLWTRSACMKYFDPETADTNNHSYPVTKTYSLGFNLGF